MLTPGALRRTPTAQWLRRMERTAWVLALVLGGVWAGARGLAYRSKERSLRAFEAEQATAASRTPGPPAIAAAMAVGTGSGTSLGVGSASIDQSLWDRGRVRAHALAPRLGRRPPAVLPHPPAPRRFQCWREPDEWTLTGQWAIDGTAAARGRATSGSPSTRRLLPGPGTSPPAMRSSPSGRLAITASSRSRSSAGRDVSVLDRPAPGATLVTCYLFWLVGSAPERFIVRAELVPYDVRVADVGAAADEHPDEQPGSPRRREMLRVAADRPGPA